MMIKGVYGSNVKFLLLPIKFEVYTVRYRPSIFSLDLWLKKKRPTKLTNHSLYTNWEK